MHGLGDGLVNARDAGTYDFLGFHICVGVGKSGKEVPKIKVGRKAITNTQRRLCEAIRYRPMQESISVRLERASAVIRGWSNYFKTTTSRKLLMGWTTRLSGSRCNRYVGRKIY